MKKILIVEDVPFNVDLLIQLLEDDFELMVAADGETSVTMALSERPDLILMDLSLPVLDGWEATRRIKADPVMQHVPIIGLSAHAMQGDDERALSAGCDAYLTKPLHEDLLFEKLSHFLHQDA
jgi:two-component system cell cycle response regulator DivK